MIRSSIIDIGIAVGAGIGLYLLEKALRWGRVQVEGSRSLRFLQEHYAVLDGVIDSLPIGVRQKLAENQIAEVAKALLSQDVDADLESGAAKQAVAWAADRFDWDIHERFDLDSLSDLDQALVRAAKDKIIQRFEE